LLQQRWNNIKAEARALADCEPMLASFYHATLLKHEDLGSALSYMLANKLASSIMPAIAIREVVEEAYAAAAIALREGVAGLTLCSWQTRRI
jgi:serine O-acetyltransferase